MSDLIHVTFFDSVKDTIPKPARLPRADLIKRMASHRRGDQKDVGGWSAARYKDDARRGSDGVEAATALVFDIDGASPEQVEAMKSRLEAEGVASQITSTFSHEPDCPSLRLVIYVSREVSPSEYPRVWNGVVHHYQIPADPAARDVSRLWFLPAAREGAPVVRLQQDGPTLDPDAFLPSNDDIERLVDEYPAAVEGEHGDARTLQLGMKLRDRGLTEEEALPWMQRFNERCSPQWSEEDLRTKLRNAFKYARGPRVFRDDHLEQDPSQVYRQTDVGNAERFRDQHMGTSMYVAATKRWYHYDGKRWADDAGHAVRKQIKTVRRIYEEAANIENEDIRKAMAAWARQSESAARIKAALEVARNLEGICVPVDELDQDQWSLNLLNGTLDLRTGQLRPHEPADRITGLVPIAFDPQAKCPTFGRYLVRVVPDPEVRAFLQRWSGYCLTGSVREQKLVFLKGPGANGKSVYLETLQRLLGSYARPMPPDLLLAKQGQTHPTEVASLMAARLVVGPEIEEGRRFAETKLKELTGGDRLLARFMHGDFFRFNPTHKIVISANNKPAVRSGGEALWRRICLVLFNVTIPETERDPDLLHKLDAELPGVLNWAVQGCLTWQREGLGSPKEVTAATAEYRTEQDNVRRFLEERCAPVTGSWISSDDLHGAYRSWCEGSGEYWKSKERFGEYLRDAGYLPTKNRGRRGWSGIALGRRGHGDPDPDAFLHEKPSREKTTGEGPPRPSASTEEENLS